MIGKLSSWRRMGLAVAVVGGIGLGAFAREGLGGADDEKAPAERAGTPPAKRTGTADWYTDPDCRLVFFATLEGLYDDGIPTEAVDLIVGKGTELSNPVKHDFVFYCKLCHAVYEAFVLYQRRQAFNGTDVDTFGARELAPELMEALRSDEARTRVYAMGELVQPWIKKRLLTLDMDDAAKEALMKRLLALVEEGNRLIVEHRRDDPEYGEDWMFYGSCQACKAIETVARMRKQD